MLSPGGKVEYTCPNCDNPHIVKGKGKFLCRVCDMYGSWSLRRKTPTKNKTVKVTDHTQ